MMISHQYINSSFVQKDDSCAAGEGDELKQQRTKTD